MQKLFNFVSICAISLAASISAADAADMAVKAPPMAPAWSWTGLYVGGNVGGAWGRSTWCTDATIGVCMAAPTDTNTESSSRVIGGGQFGARWQDPHNFVVGVEAMFDGLNISNTIADAAIVPAFPGRTRTTSFTGIDSVTAQLGYAWNRTLLYGKAGWAGTRLGLDAKNTNPGGLDLNNSAFINGFAAGAGLEFMVTSNISVGVEYDYYGFLPNNILNLTNSGGVVIPCAFCNFGYSTNVQTVTARLNVKLWGPGSLSGR